ncbi:MAG: sigma-54 dependent transcriptional regulator [Desulfobacterota bacterium]|nr:sigma-54 dependent transcriptional regulator [Thermodesulfobacteriota bacterium]
MKEIILIEDDSGVRFFIEEALRREGHRVLSFESYEKASSSIKEDTDLVLIDIKLPGIDGLSAIEEIKRFTDAPIIVITAYGTKKNAMLAIEKGAIDFFVKPISLEELKVVVKRALAKREIEKEAKLKKKEWHDATTYHGIVVKSEMMKEVIRLAERVAETDVPVLITGETGVGKEVVARLIHKLSNRKGEFVPVNCASIPETLLESELFGFEKGAFTGAVREKKGKFELAEKGTLFLDEIGEMGPNLQAKILRVVETKELERLGSTKKVKLDVRIISATNKNLIEAMGEGKFRPDLYYRLSGVVIDVPPLRKRKEDIGPLIDHFLLELEKDLGRKLGISKEAKEYLLNYAWPGNVRELLACLKSAVSVSEDGYVTLEDLPIHMRERTKKHYTEGTSLDEQIEELERKRIIEALKATKGNQKKAASILGISERSIWYRIKKHGIDVSNL